MRAFVALGVALVLLVVAEGSTVAIPASPVAAYGSPMLPVTVPITADARSAPAAMPGPGEARLPAQAVIHDFGAPPIPTAARRSQPAPERGAVVKVIPPARYSASTSHVLRGRASWYCNSNGSRDVLSSCHNAYPDSGGFDGYAAAGPRLRNALGSGWRGRVVSVDGLRVKLVDWCQCYQGQSNEKLIDVYLDVYREVGGSVTIRW